MDGESISPDASTVVEQQGNSDATEISSEQNADVSEWDELMGKDIMVKYRVKGSGEIAAFGAIVTCNYSCYMNNFETPFESYSNQNFKVGDGDAFPGLELPLRHSRVGDIFTIKCSSKFAFGPSGRPSIKKSNSNGDSNNGAEATTSGDDIVAIPPDTDLLIDVEVLNHQTEDSFVEGSREKAVFVLTIRKECGNRWFSYGDFTRAARAYSKGADVADGYLKGVSNASEGDNSGSDIATISWKDEGAVIDLYLACLNNLAACLLNKKEFHKAREVCIRVLELDPRNIKGLLRAARSALAMHEHEETEACVNRILEIDPNNSLALKEAAKLKAAKKKYAESSREMSRKMTKQLFGQESSSAENFQGSNVKQLDVAVEPAQAVAKSESRVDTATSAESIDFSKTKPTSDPTSDSSIKTSELAPEQSLQPPRRSSLFVLLFTSITVVVVALIISFLARDR